MDNHVNKINRFGQLDGGFSSDDSEMALFNKKEMADRRIETLYKGINARHRDLIWSDYKKQDQLKEDLNRDALSRLQKKHIKYDDDNNEIYTPTKKEKKNAK